MFAFCFPLVVHFCQIKSVYLFVCLLICLRNSYLVSLTWKKERKDDCFHLLIDSSDACKSKGRPAKTRNLEPSPVLHVDVIVCFPDSGLEVEPGLSPLGTPMWYTKMSQPLRHWHPRFLQVSSCVWMRNEVWLYPWGSPVYSRSFVQVSFSCSITLASLWKLNGFACVGHVLVHWPLCLSSLEYQNVLIITGLW